MAKLSERWWGRPQIWVEVFAILNVGFLTFDIYLAHSVNQFRNQAEYIPLILLCDGAAAADCCARSTLSLACRLEEIWAISSDGSPCLSASPEFCFTSRATSFTSARCAA